VVHDAKAFSEHESPEHRLFLLETFEGRVTPPHVCAVKKVTQIFQLLMTMDEINVHSDSMMQTRTHKNVIGVHTKHGNT